MAKKIYISPSDQTGNVYAAGNTNEAVQCRQIAQLLAAALLRCGFETRLDLTAGMYERVAESNAWGADLHVPIHTNAFNGTVSGTRLMCYSTDSEGYRACEAVFAHLAPITPGTSENITVHPELYECRAANAPCVYVEADFHDVGEVALWIIGHKREIAEAICHGICDHFGVAYVEEEEAEVRYQYLRDVPQVYREETIDRLIRLGIIQGKAGEGEDLLLDIGEDALRVMIWNDRAGLYPTGEE